MARICLLLLVHLGVVSKRSKRVVFGIETRFRFRRHEQAIQPFPPDRTRNTCDCWDWYHPTGEVQFHKYVDL